MPRPAAAWGRAQLLRWRRCSSILQGFLTRLSVAPPTPMDRATALPTGTNHLRGNSALRSRGFGLPSRATTGTKSFAVNRKQSFEVKRNLSVGMISQTNVAAAADLGAAGRRTPRHAGLRSSADDLPVRLSATTS